MSIRIDKDADILEFITKEINKLSKFAFTGIDITEEILETISYYEEYNMTIRENLIDKQRILSSILKSYRFPPDIKEEFKIMIKDVSSLIDYTTFNFEKLSYLQNIFLGLINLEQNKIVKTLTTLSLLFLPSTLIASIYGMNFKYMPGLEWKFGFVMAIMLMLFITGITYLFIRQKGS
jgi:magnesium transporter